MFYAFWYDLAFFMIALISMSFVKEGLYSSSITLLSDIRFKN